jgi:hypothetical protein
MNISVITEGLFTLAFAPFLIVLCMPVVVLGLIAYANRPSLRLPDEIVAEDALENLFAENRLAQHWSLSVADEPTEFAPSGLWTTALAREATAVSLEIAGTTVLVPTTWRGSGKSMPMVLPGTRHVQRTARRPRRATPALHVPSLFGDVATLHP